MSFDPVPVTLEGRRVRVEPLALRHAEDLYVAGIDKEIWKYMPIPPPESVDDINRWITNALKIAADGTQIPFAIVHARSRKAVGSTRFLDIQRENSSLEIGWTWLGKEFQRTAINTECKYLLLEHAFEHLKAVRVALKTDGRNLQSQRAIERIGALREGTLRKHRRNWDGFVRDTVYFSIVDSEWPAVKARLMRLMVAERPERVSGPRG